MEFIMTADVIGELWRRVMTPDVIMDVISVLVLLVADYAGVMVAVMIDLRSGILASKERGRKIVSKGYRRTVVKLMNYMMLLLALTSVDIMIMAISVCVNIGCGVQLPVVPLLTTGGAAALGLIEAKSVRENACGAVADVSDALNEAVEKKSAVALLKWLFTGLKSHK